MWWSVRRERKGLLVGVAIAIGWTLTRVAVPWSVRKGIDDGIEGGDSLLKWAVIITTIGTVSAVFTGLRRHVAFRNARRVERTLRNRLFAHVQTLHFAYHDSVQTGDLMSRANTDLQQFQNFVTMIPITVGNAVVVSAVTIILFTTNAQLALLALIFLPALQVIGKRFGRQIHPAVLGIQNESAELAAVVEETVAGIRVIKGFGAEKSRAELLSKEATDVYHQSMIAARIRSFFWPAVELLPNMGLIVVLWWGGRLVLNGDLSVGELVSFNIYVTMLIQPVRMLGMIISSAQRANAAGSRINKVLSTSAEITDPPYPKSLPTAGPVGRVGFNSVGFSYPQSETDTPAGRNVQANTTVLQDFDLTIEPGETVALVGATGSGKSTVARLIPRFYDVTSGSITLDGVDVRHLSLQELRPSVGIVFEDTFLFSESVYTNIAFANPDASPAEVEQAARLAGAHEFIVNLNQGYDTILGERGYSLSGGQRQRIAIARAVLANPRVVILDDATSAVDPTTEHEIRDALEEVMGKRTTIVIAHRPATIALADRVVLLDEGRVVAQGTHRQLLETHPKYQQVLAASDRAGAN